MPVNNWPKQTLAEMNAFYGNPDKNNDGAPDIDWQQQNLTTIIPPYDLYYPRQNSNGTITKRGTKFSKITINKACADSLYRVLDNIGRNFSVKDREKYELDICGGAFNFRPMRSGASLSVHSWAAAIDLSHLINYYKRPYDSSPNSLMMPQRAVDIFADEGWVWGGKWRIGDAMHFQAARI